MYAEMAHSLIHLLTHSARQSSVLAVHWQASPTQQINKPANANDKIKHIIVCLRETESRNKAKSVKIAVNRRQSEWSLLGIHSVVHTHSHMHAHASRMYSIHSMYSEMSENSASVCMRASSNSADCFATWNKMRIELYIHSSTLEIPLKRNTIELESVEVVYAMLL